MDAGTVVIVCGTMDTISAALYWLKNKFTAGAGGIVADSVAEKLPRNIR